MHRVHILFRFQDGPWGGGNQFLKALRGYLRDNGVYAEDPQEADVLLFNAYPFGSEDLFAEAYRLKKRNPHLLLLHRVDGPVLRVRGRDVEIDRIIFFMNEKCMDGTLFQSNWSRKACRQLGMGENRFETTLINAPAASIFNPTGRIPPPQPGEPLRLVATSWSKNMRKGFAVYQWLDEHLDFSRHEMTFIGNSPIKFNNIKHIPPLDSQGVAHHLKRHHVYITAAMQDPCSNSLIEALHCGLPTLALRDGGHPEIVGQGGLFFERAEEIPGLLETLAQDYVKYQQGIHLPSMQEVGQAYYAFMGQTLAGTRRAKPFSRVTLWRIQAMAAWKRHLDRRRP